MDLAELTKGMEEKVSGGVSLATTVKFDFGDDGIISLDTKASPPVVSNDDIDADCTVVVTMDDFKEIVAGNLNAQMAFMTGKLKIEGDMGIAMQLGQILG
ncbi:MAG: SCP2 sterol-binding domain-containing protein [Sphingomonadales bacterium]|nr:SCP2 sterol-binding domain-containing protein [Sphingomonadales bacterium]